MNAEGLLCGLSFGGTRMLTTCIISEPTWNSKKCSKLLVPLRAIEEWQNVCLMFVPTGSISHSRRICVLALLESLPSLVCATNSSHISYGPFNVISVVRQ